MGSDNISISEQAAIRKILDEFLASNSVPSIVLKAERKEVKLSGSKFGGKPYLPKGLTYPRDNKGEPLKFLAQLNFGELPKLPDYPQQGILQFFIRADDIMGMGFDDLEEQDGFRIIYHKDILDEELLSDQCPEIDYEYFPFEGEFRITGQLSLCPLTSADYRFDDIFMSVYRKLTNSDDESLLDLEDDISEIIYEELNLMRHRIGGYPYFTQTDQENMMKSYINTIPCSFKWIPMGMARMKSSGEIAE